MSYASLSTERNYWEKPMLTKGNWACCFLLLSTQKRVQNFKCSIFSSHLVPTPQICTCAALASPSTLLVPLSPLLHPLVHPCNLTGWDIPWYLLLAKAPPQPIRLLDCNNLDYINLEDFFTTTLTPITNFIVLSNWTYWANWTNKIELRENYITLLIS